MKGTWRLVSVIAALAMLVVTGCSHSANRTGADATLASTRTTIGAAGGAIHCADPQAPSLTIPPSALTAPLTVTATPLIAVALPDTVAGTPVGHALSLRLDGTLPERGLGLRIFENAVRCLRES